MSDGLDLSQFYETFFDEADELLADMEQLLLTLGTEAPDGEQLDAIFRTAHSIKGGAATFGVFELLAQTTHLLENLLDAVRRKELPWRAGMIDALLEAKDVLKGQLDAYRASQAPDQAECARICEVLRQLRGEEGQSGDVGPNDDAADASAATSAGTVLPTPVPVSVETLPLRVRFVKVNARDLASLKAELANLGRVLASEDATDGGSVWLETSCSEDDIEAVCSFVINAEQMVMTREAAPEVELVETVIAETVEIADTPETRDATAQPAAESVAEPAVSGNATRKKPTSAAAGEKESSSIRVGVEKVDQIINLVGELVITQAMLTQTATTLDPVLHDRLLNGMEQLERNARDLQEAVMSIRMMPMDYVFSRFPRVVRDNAAKLGKQIELHTEGGATELDKSLIERIIDPLTHLVRNSLDHGIEPPGDRVTAGKPPQGKLTLSARHSGGNIVIEVSDDGRGLNRQKLLAKAAQKGWNVSDQASDEEVWQLIFAPGFSTADAITDISGRGVGMDVVRRNIQDLGGHVQLFSHAGAGTTTRIVLPLTLAILDGMAVRVGAETFILPLNHVTESLQPTPQHLHAVAGQARMLRVRGEYLPLVVLSQVFGVADAQTDPLHAIAVILQAEEQRFALLVDQLVTQQQVVVKNLESNYRKVPGISAATILGDGSVALIVDVFTLARESHPYRSDRSDAIATNFTEF